MCLCWFPGFLTYAWDVNNIHKVLSRGLYLKGQIENRFPFTGQAPFSGLNQPSDSLSFGGIYNCRGIYNCNPDHKMTIRGNVCAWYWVGTRRSSTWSDLFLRRVESNDIFFSFPVTTLPQLGFLGFLTWSTINIYRVLQTTWHFPVNPSTGSAFPWTSEIF
jgi:hypothetical protein